LKKPIDAVLVWKKYQKRTNLSAAKDVSLGVKITLKTDLLPPSKTNKQAAISNFFRILDDTQYK
jgi:hypothetical protein